MNTEGFAQMLGRTLDQTLLTQGPLKRAADQQIEAAQQALNIPSRSQLTSVAKQIVQLEERVERVEDGVTAIQRRLDQVARMLTDREAAARAEREKEPR